MRINASNNFFALILCLFFALCTAAQQCVLKVGAWEANAETIVNGGRLRTRKATVMKFTSTVINQKTRKTYRGVYVMGYAYYENAPQGIYKVTVRKTGFKTSVQEHVFECDSDNRIDFVDVLLVRGKPTSVFANTQVKEMRLDRITKLGSTDSDTGARVEPRDPSKSTEPCKGTAPKVISGGVLNGKAYSLAKPPYPPAAKAVRASGAVSVQVLIDESGNVVSANAVSGHPLLRDASESAARGSTFSPTLLCGQPVKVSGLITYNFVP